MWFEKMISISEIVYCSFEVTLQDSKIAEPKNFDHLFRIGFWRRYNIGNQDYDALLQSPGWLSENPDAGGFTNPKQTLELNNEWKAGLRFIEIRLNFCVNVMFHLAEYPAKSFIPCKL